ncbi:MAG: pre-peptidase C-terminal domain-containing protein, partial [Planctomycetota bacterium]|nr:pre-peptidase C-terminal domain-containing protein [Planctomycetota bacterium]
DLGFVGIGDTVESFNLGMRDDADIDWLAFTVPASARVSATVAPLGFEYLQQGQDSACNTGSQFNSLDRIDLNFDIVDADGSTILASADSNPAGQPESIVDLDLPGAGTYYLRVRPGAAAGVAQVYDVSVSVVSGAPPCPADLDGDGQVGPSDLGALLGTWGGSGAADLDGDGTVGSADLGALLGSWGPCP